MTQLDKQNVKKKNINANKNKNSEYNNIVYYSYYTTRGIIKALSFFFLLIADFPAHFLIFFVVGFECFDELPTKCTGIISSIIC